MTAIADVVWSAIPQDWREQAACRHMDPAIFHPQGGTGRSAMVLVREAKAICANCPVEDDCLEYALRVETIGSEAGVWGGTTPDERRRITRERHASAQKRIPPRRTRND